MLKMHNENVVFREKILLIVKIIKENVLHLKRFLCVNFIRLVFLVKKVISNFEIEKVLIELQF